MSILEYLSLKPYNTFGVNSTAHFFTRVRTTADIISLIEDHFQYYKKILILGEGSNILLCNDFDGLVIKNEIIGIELIKEDDEHVWIKSMSGTNWHELVIYCVNHNWGGIENLSLIPGTAGAAPMQNIGAYGAEIQDTFVSLEAIDLKTAETLVFNKEACNFGYRQSIFKSTEKNNYFISSITLKLSKHPVVNTAYGDIQKTLGKNGIKNPTIKNVSDAVIEIRESKLPNPHDIGNAGSFFKNPEVEKAVAEKIKKEFPAMPSYDLPDGKVKIPAGWLIEQCGWKGKRLGDTGNHDRQALVIVNYGNATGEEIRQHALAVQNSVQQQFNILLVPEVNIIL
ncbi:MAG: UDP-N-acetylmuramate dehydrogenase [Bacteroidota bacterium]|nr:UDP-N-acetylmuramate dehydrogenase [Bacteroidota bacterium]